MTTLAESLSQFNIQSKLFKQQSTFTSDQHHNVNNFRAWDYLTLFDNLAQTKYSKQYKTERQFSSFNLETFDFNLSTKETVEHNIMPICLHRRKNHFYMESYTPEIFKKLIQEDIKEGKALSVFPIKEEYHNHFHHTLLVIKHKTKEATYYNPKGYLNHFYNSNDEVKDAITSCLESFLLQFFQTIVPELEFQFHEKNEELNQEFTFPDIKYDFDQGQEPLLTFLLGHLLSNGLQDVLSFYKLLNQLSDIGKAELIYNFASTVCKEFNQDNTPEDKTQTTSRGSPVPFEKDIAEDYDKLEDLEEIEETEEKNQEIEDSLEKAKLLFSEIERLKSLIEELNK